MKYLLLFLGLTALANAFSLNLKTFSADFEQRITDENREVISYKGHVWADKNNQALWVYSSPISKKVYIQGGDVKIVEEELEQVIIKKLNKDIDFLALLKEAKKVTKDQYRAVYLDNTYTIYTNNVSVKRISYIDNFANKVEIIFTAQKQNETIENSIFEYTVPEDFDILRE